MTKKDYQLISSSLKSLNFPPSTKILQEVAKKTRDTIAFILCSRFKQNDDRFNEQVFLKACGYYD